MVVKCPDPMNCFVHDRVSAVGICASCQKAMCRECVGRDAPRLVCRACSTGRAILGFEYRSAAAIGEWPLVHVCAGMDPATMRPKVAKGVIAIGNIAVGVVAIAGVSLGVVSLGGLSLGLLFAAGGAAIGVGVSMGGLAIGSIAVGGLAIGFVYAIGGAAVGAAVADGARCDPPVRDFIVQWFGTDWLPPACF
jgi:hypothetical protein